MDCKNSQNREWHFKDRNIPGECDPQKGGKAEIETMAASAVSVMLRNKI